MALVCRAATRAVVVAAIMASSAARADSDAYCGTYFDQPDIVRFNGSCSTLATPEGLVSSTGTYFTMGDAFEAAAPTITWAGRGVTPCKDDATPSSSIAYRQRTPGGHSILAARFDLVPVPLMSSAGFDPDFILDTATSWASVTAFFDDDASADCSGGCTWSDNYGGAGGHADFAEPYRLRDLIDDAGGDYRTKVYYLPDSTTETDYGPEAAMGDLSNAEYRAWRVADVRALLATGAYDMVMLNHKFCQWRFGNENWLNGDLGTACGESGQVISDVTKLHAANSQLFTAEPTGYGWTEYVQGWAAMADDLKAAGVPFAVYLSDDYWTSTSTYDDPATADVNEATLITDTAEDDADLVILDYGDNGRGASHGVVKLLQAAGREVLVVDQRCGQYGTNMVWGTPTTRARIPVNTAHGPNR